MKHCSKECKVWTVECCNKLIIATTNQTLKQGMWNVAHNLITATTNKTLKLRMWNVVHKLIKATTNETLEEGMWSVDCGMVHTI